MDSLPPHLLRAPGSQPGSPARGRLEGDQPSSAARAVTAPEQSAPQMAGHQQSPLLVAGPGTPGAYEPAVPASQRPRNVTELGERVTPASPEPWPAGTYLPVGARGKRAHWTGSSWKGGDSPGYGETVTVRSATEQTEGR